MDNTFEERPDFEDDADFSDLVPEANAETSEDNFSEQWRQDFYGLSLIGFLEEEFDLYGHTIRIKTLKAGEDLAASLVIKEYEGSIGQGKAGYAAQVAACLISVDGQPLPRSLANDRRANIREGFNYVIENYDFDTVIAPIWQRWQHLTERKVAVANELLSK